MRIPLPMTGGCQCRRHTYRITAPPRTVYACHCRECQVQSGSAFSMSMPVPREAFVCDGDDLGLRVRRSASGREVGLRFCRDCGVRLYHEPERDRSIVNVKPGTLDDPSWVRPVGHLWLASAQPWARPPVGPLTFERQPDSFAPLREAFAAWNSAE